MNRFETTENPAIPRTSDVRLNPCRVQKVKPFLFIVAQSTICRDELLFEIELDAITF